jgi:alkanesulfonate monooxygenase SsuD/methylene tetrahydromethanopterin reductase-like flavin-dependent oxidoreductase (luciferase family)
VRLGLRYDLRSPPFGAGAPELWAAALEQCAWADRLGVETVFLGEHHGDLGGYNPSPIVLAAAVLGRTTQLGVHISALVAPLHDPVRLAEDLAALSLLGPGRVEVTLGIGYRPHELAMFGVDPASRQERLDACLDVLVRGWRGEELDVDGRPVVVRPLPPPGQAPRLYLGGSTEAAARRAARAGMGFRPGFPALWDTYAAELRALGRPVADAPPTSGPTFLFVTHEPEADLARLAPNLLDTTNTYARWALERGGGRTKYRKAATPTDLLERGFRFVTPEQCLVVADELGADGELRFHPLMGGIDPDDSWRSLELFEREVVPTLVARGWRPSPRPA